MIRVTKENNDGLNSVINVETSEGSFYISFEKNLNLSFSYLGNNVDNEGYYSFVIDKSNGYFYKCFNDLYDSIINQRPYRYSDNLANTEYIFPLNNCKEKLVKDGIIEWHSDYEPYDTANILSIIKNEDADYILTFFDNGKTPYNNEHTVYIQNGGSRYDPYNATFMILYNKLRNYDFERYYDEGIDNTGFIRTRKR